jgi:hypothetical protein
MKQTDFLKVLAQDLGTKDLAEVNKLLKAKSTPPVKYRFSGKSLGHYGFTGLIKSIAADGVKVFDIKKVTLIKFSDIEKFEKAKPRAAHPERPKDLEIAKKAPSADAKALADSAPEAEEKVYKLNRRPPGKSGSSFIPTAGRAKGRGKI